jgi:hypothetical protein
MFDPVSAHFPKFAVRFGSTYWRTSESQGHWQIYDSGTAYRSEVLNERAACGLQIGGADHPTIANRAAKPPSGQVQRGNTCQ